VTKVRRADLAQTVDLTADFLSWRQVEIHAKVAGYVKQMNVDVGDHSKTGDMLMIWSLTRSVTRLSTAR
jgi:multidrug efflux pump subunit AcrA (membrane-fusion protein)